MKSQISLQSCTAVLLLCASWAFAAGDLGASCTAASDCNSPLVCASSLCSEPLGTQTCSWAGHGIGTSCSTDDDCSDALICTTDSFTCWDASVPEWLGAFYYRYSCYNYTWYQPPPTDCEGRVCRPRWLSQMRLEVIGENFNTGEVLMQIKVGSSEATLETVYDGTVSAVAGVPGQAAGAFTLQTQTECPWDNEAFYIWSNATDLCTGKSALGNLERA